MKTKNYYVGYSYMGLNFSYDSECWRVYAFTSKKARDNYIQQNSYDGRQLIAKAITRKTAEKILGQSLDRAVAEVDYGYFKVLTV